MGLSYLQHHLYFYSRVLSLMTGKTVVGEIADDGRHQMTVLSLMTVRDRRRQVADVKVQASIIDLAGWLFISL
jgi:hypothetical protein